MQRLRLRARKPRWAKELPLPNLLIEELIKIQSPNLSVLTDPEPKSRDILQHQKHHATDAKTVPSDGANLRQLVRDLDSIPIDRAGVPARAVKGTDGLVCEDASQEAADDTTDAVQLEDFQPVVDAEEDVDVFAESADDGGHEPDHGGQPYGDVACCRRDADEASDAALTGADEGDAAAVTHHVYAHPADDAEGGRDVGVEGGVHGADAGVEGRAAVEAEPACPILGVSFVIRG